MEVGFPAKPGRHSVTELSVDGTSITSPKYIAKTLNNQFQKVLTTPDRDTQPNQSKYTVDKPMLPIAVSKDDIDARLKNLNKKKSIGPDRIHPWTLKEAHAELALPLTALFQMSLDIKIVPQDWWKDNITPIYKCSSKVDPKITAALALHLLLGKFWRQW